ncbi:hypothetical protein O1O06_11780 [Grimontia hollisae]|uniref:hypothetical protein n=1 Tax=Grimontia hollisae TaxID=673 RepID=UPI0023DA8A28|nr:hypothetical protein [Grimontia hollisae]MDF2185442.1 hypothetical protein [Grimontia hollisae]
MIKVYFDDSDPSAIETFIHGEGFYTFKSRSSMEMELSSEHENIEWIPLTPELYNEMQAAGDFDGFAP